MPRKFGIVGEMQDVQIIATGDAVRERHRLNRTYAGGKLTRWRKLKGFAWVRYDNGAVVWAEIHWFEAHGIGRREEKVKREIRQ